MDDVVDCLSLGLEWVVPSPFGDWDATCIAAFELLVSSPAAFHGLSCLLGYLIFANFVDRVCFRSG